MQTTYRTEITKSPRGAIKGELFEHDVLVATFTKPANGGWNYIEVKVRFLSDRAAVRFDSFCDSLSRAETLEALSV